MGATSQDPFEQGLAPIVYRIDERDDIVFVDDNWRRSAFANAAPDLADGAVGRPLWDFVAGPETRLLWRELLTRVRSGVTTEVPLRCDSPGRRRRVSLQLEPLAEQGVQFSSTLMQADDRTPIALLNSLYAEGDPIRACGWCRRVDVEGYVEVEVAVARLGLLEQDSRPVTHTLCDDCAAAIREQIARQAATG